MPAATRTAVPQELRNPGGPLATEAQRKFIHDLLDRKNLFASTKFFDAHNAMDKEEFAAVMKKMHERVDTRLTKRDASQWIGQLKALPNKPAEESGKKEESQAPKVPAGHYALEYPEDELNPIRFYKVKDGKDNTDKGGRDWTGFQFVERFVSDDTFPVKGKERYRVLEAIAANPLAAAQRYGDESQRCFDCNRGLTRRLSRHLRMGPICLRKHPDVWGIDVEEYIATSRQAILDSGHDPDEVLPKPRSRRHIIDHA